MTQVNPHTTLIKPPTMIPNRNPTGKRQDRRTERSRSVPAAHRWAALVLLIGFVLMPTVGRAETPTDALHGVFETALETYEQAQQALASDSARARRLFQLAAQQFESIRASGIESGPLEYNLGNCYLQAGDVGRAILHYRRAQRLIPNDPRLKTNLAEARRRCLTAIPPSRERRVLRDVFFWHYQSSVAQRSRWALLAYVVFWIALSARCVWRRRWLGGAAITACAIALASGASVAVTDWQERNTPDGVVLTMDVTVHRGPGASYPRQFEQPLQPGTEFTRINRRGAWWEIELPDGKTGWIDGTTAELIRESP